MPDPPTAENLARLSFFQNNDVLKKAGDSGSACMPRIECQQTYDFTKSIKHEGLLDDYLG